jgi:hypothetical protein
MCYLFNYNKIRFLNILFSVSSQHRNSLFFRISVNNIVKCTKTHSLKSTANEKNPVIKFNDVKYFSVQVMLKFSSRYNNISL